MKYSVILTAALFASYFGSVGPRLLAAEYGVNLLLNGDAEQGPSGSGGAVAAIPGWTPTGAATVVKYDTPGGFPTANDPGPFDRASAFFAGGSAAVSTLKQDIDVSNKAADIDAGKVACDVTAWLGGFGTDDDNATFSVTFLQANGSAVSGSTVVSVGPVLAADRASATKLLLRTASKTVPAGTRLLRATLTMTRTSNTYNDGYADSLSILLRGPVVVTSTADSGAGSLRDAIPRATAITFDPVAFGPANAPHVIDLTSGALPIQTDLNLTGPGSDLLTVRQTATDDLFEITPSNPNGPNTAVTIQSLTAIAIIAINTRSCDVTLKNMVVRGSSAGGLNTIGAEFAAGIIRISNCLIADETAGGLFFLSSTVFLDATTVTNCHSVYAFAALDINFSILIAANSTFSGNVLVGSGSSIKGIIYSDSSTATLANCTLSGNQVPSASGYSTIALDTKSSLTLSSCTIADNSGTALLMTGDDSIELGNTIIFDVQTFSMTGSGNTIKSDGYNLSQDNGQGFLKQTGDRPLTTAASLNLGPLQDNGGPTFTRALLPGSIAIDKGNTALHTDQRGAPRPVDDPNSFDGGGGNADIGAFEFQGVPPVVLANISGRLPVGTGDNALFAGFIVSGYQPKKVVIRAIGPSLGIAGRLADPTLELRDSNGVLLQANDNWIDSPNKQAIIDSQVAPTSDLESAIVATLPAGIPGSSYTAIVRGANNATGIGVVEVYDLDRTVDSKLANISNRGFVQTGDNALFAGNIVLGQVSQKVIIRALGPSTGVPGAMADPTLELHDANGGLLESNDNWVDSPNKKAIIDSTIPPSNNLESAIVRTLPPANYTAIVRGANNTTGIAVVEVYALN